MGWSWALVPSFGSYRAPAAPRRAWGLSDPSFRGFGAPFLASLLVATWLSFCRPPAPRCSWGRMAFCARSGASLASSPPCRPWGSLPASRSASPWKPFPPRGRRRPPSTGSWALAPWFRTRCRCPPCGGPAPGGRPTWPSSPPAPWGALPRPSARGGSRCGLCPRFVLRVRWPSRPSLPLGGLGTRRGRRRAWASLWWPTPLRRSSLCRAFRSRRRSSPALIIWRPGGFAAFGRRLKRSGATFGGGSMVPSLRGKSLGPSFARSSPTSARPPSVTPRGSLGATLTFRRLLRPPWRIPPSFLGARRSCMLRHPALSPTSFAPSPLSPRWGPGGGPLACPRWPPLVEPLTWPLSPFGLARRRETAPAPGWRRGRGLSRRSSPSPF